MTGNLKPGAVVFSVRTQYLAFTELAICQSHTVLLHILYLITRSLFYANSPRLVVLQTLGGLI
jgi:hypothetical protein